MNHFQYKEHYFNFRPIPLVENPSPNYQSIVSFPSLIYGLDNYEIIKLITWRLNSKLRTNYNLDIGKATEISRCIENAPKVDLAFIIYRGLPHTVEDLGWKKGQVLSNLGFIFGSINKLTAEFYSTHNTMPCYFTDQVIRMQYAIKLKTPGVLMSIHIPNNFSFLENSSVNFCTQQDIDNEIILNYTTKLKIIDIKNNEVICEVF